MISEYLKKLQFYGKLSFTIEEAVKDLGLPKDTIYKGLTRLKTKGEIVTPVKGLYVIVPAEYSQNGCLPAKELVPLIMDYLYIKYYAALLTAGMFHGATHQKPSVFQIVTTKRFKKDIHCGTTHIEFIYKKSLAGLSTQSFPVRTGELILSSPEVTAMDLFLYPQKSGGINHIATVLSELVEALDPDKLISLAEESKQKAWIQRLGYVLDNIDSYEPGHQQKVIDALASYVSSQELDYRPLTSKVPMKGHKRSEKWKIAENISVESDL